MKHVENSTNLIMGLIKKSTLFINRRKKEKARVFLLVLFSIGILGIFVTLENLSRSVSPQLKDGNVDMLKASNVFAFDYTNTQEIQSNLKPILPLVKVTKDTKTNNSNNSMQIVNNGNKEFKNVSIQSQSKSRSQAKAYVPLQSDWQPVTGAVDKFYVYSAYYVHKPFHLVRVIGAARTKTRQHVQCRLYDQDGNHYMTVDGTIQTIRENWNLKYSACFTVCPLPRQVTIPYFVSVMPSSSPKASATNLLRITNEKDVTGSIITPEEFSACVKPMHYNYNNVMQFLEWMEFHKLMGVGHFTFYNHTIGDKVDCLLTQLYKDIVTVLPWNLPMTSQKEIRTEGLFAALNDCVYRHRGASKYLILVDLDEMIVPRKLGNYSQLLSQLDTLSNKKKIGAYSFQNGFFYMQWADDQSNYNLTQNTLPEAVSHHLLMLRKTRRKSRFHPHKQRSKYICDPEKVVEAGNHFVWEMVAGYNTLSVPSHVASLHHYRVCEFGGNQCVKTPSVVDKSIVPFAQALAVNVAQQLQNFEEICHISVQEILQK